VLQLLLHVQKRDLIILMTQQNKSAIWQQCTTSTQRYYSHLSFKDTSSWLFRRSLVKIYDVSEVLSAFIIALWWRQQAHLKRR
jgi:hypothetical protein